MNMNTLSQQYSSGMALPSYSQHLDELLTNIWSSNIESMVRQPQPKVYTERQVKELEKKVEELDVINKPGVRWLRKKV